MRMFITALFIITQTWKQSICTSINEQTLGLRCNELFYSNKTETSYQAGQKMVRNLKYILPSERIQSKTATYSTNPSMWQSRKKGSLQRQWADQWLPRSGGRLLGVPEAFQGWEHPMWYASGRYIRFCILKICKTAQHEVLIHSNSRL